MIEQQRQKRFCLLYRNLKARKLQCMKAKFVKKRHGGGVSTSRAATVESSEEGRNQLWGATVGLAQLAHQICLQSALKNTNSATNDPNVPPDMPIL